MQAFVTESCTLKVQKKDNLQEQKVQFGHLKNNHQNK